MKNNLNIFFAGAIRGGRTGQPMYKLMMNELSQFGTVLNPHVAEDDVSDFGETDLTKQHIHARELERLNQADLVVAEVTTPSLGVGFLIAKALERQKPVICFYQGKDTYKLSAMIKGDERVRVITYQTDDELRTGIQSINQKNG